MLPVEHVVVVVDALGASPASQAELLRVLPALADMEDDNQTPFSVVVVGENHLGLGEEYANVALAAATRLPRLVAEGVYVLTPNETLASQARSLGATVLDVTVGGGGYGWANALLALAVSAGNLPHNLSNAIGSALLLQGFDDPYVASLDASGNAEVRARRFTPLEGEPVKGIGKVKVPLPVTASITFDATGHIAVTKTLTPHRDQLLAEAKELTRDLLRHDKIALGQDSSLPGRTHRLIPDEDGGRRLVRDGYE